MPLRKTTPSHAHPALPRTLALHRPSYGNWKSALAISEIEVYGHSTCESSPPRVVSCGGNCMGMDGGRAGTGATRVGVRKHAALHTTGIPAT